jgi:hypothetical protein
MGRINPDHPVHRRRAMAAMAAAIAKYNEEHVGRLVIAADELGVPVPLEVVTFPRALAAWADQIQSTREHRP